MRLDSGTMALRRLQTPQSLDREVSQVRIRIGYRERCDERIGAFSFPHNARWLPEATVSKSCRIGQMSCGGLCEPERNGYHLLSKRSVDWGLQVQLKKGGYLWCR